MKKILRFVPLLVVSTVTFLWFFYVIGNLEETDTAALGAVIGLVVSLILMPIPSLILGAIPCGYSKYLYAPVVFLLFLACMLISPLTLEAGWIRLGLLLAGEALLCVGLADLVRYAITKLIRSLKGTKEAPQELEEQE